MEQEQTTICTLSSDEANRLKDGVNFIQKPGNLKLVIFKDPGAENTDEGPASDHTFKVCLNKCKHQGGTFIKDIEDTQGCVLRCTKHGWKLDASTMRYVNPPDCFSQEDLVPELNEDGTLSVVELRPCYAWEADKRDPAPLQVGEVQVTYLTHACIELNLGGLIMVTDPWLTGPAFARGWWLMHEPPPDCWERLAKADLIYISHLHSDHLNYPTLELLSKRNPDIPIYVGDTAMPVFVGLEQSGVKLNNIHVKRFIRHMDRGHLILNTVDCTNPNGGRLPNGVDLMLSDFAGGASGFPMTFCGGKYTEDWKATFIKRERRKLLNYKKQLVQELRPLVYCPFAGYFVEAHPSDQYIRSVNEKNDPDVLNDLIRKNTPGTKTWTPRPGAVLDLQKAINGDGDFIQDPPPGTKKFKDSWNFQKYVDKINSNIGDEIFTFPEWIQFYYKWTGFKNYNLVIRMIERDDDFQPVTGGYDFLVDFEGDEPTFPLQRPAREHNYVQIENRMGVHRETVRWGLFWDNLYIGFNNRISRDPDTFHFVFWNHMQILLPRTGPDWSAFLKEMQRPAAERNEVSRPSLAPAADINSNTENAVNDTHINGTPSLTSPGKAKAKTLLGESSSYLRTYWKLLRQWAGPLLFMTIAAVGMGVALYRK